jgi:hypothetical protein
MGAFAIVGIKLASMGLHAGGLEHWPIIGHFFEAMGFGGGQDHSGGGFVVDDTTGGGDTTIDPGPDSPPIVPGTGPETTPTAPQIPDLPGETPTPTPDPTDPGTGAQPTGPIIPTPRANH